MIDFHFFFNCSGTLVIKTDDFGLDFHKISLSLVLLRPAEMSPMLKLYGNGSIRRAAIFGTCRNTSQ